MGIKEAVIFGLSMGGALASIFGLIYTFVSLRNGRKTREQFERHHKENMELLNTNTEILKTSIEILKSIKESQDTYHEQTMKVLGENHKETMKVLNGISENQRENHKETMRVLEENHKETMRVLEENHKETMKVLNGISENQKVFTSLLEKIIPLLEKITSIKE